VKWPTIRSTDGERGGRGDLLQAVRGNKSPSGRFATPTAGKANKATMEKNSRPLSEQIGGQLNPEFVEWLMGWPLGWSGLKPLATAKSRNVLPRHGGD